MPFYNHSNRILYKTVPVLDFQGFLLSATLDFNVLTENYWDNALVPYLLGLSGSTVDTVSTIGTVSGSYYGAVLAPNGTIYGIPFDASNVLKIDPDTDTVSTIGTVSGGFRGGVLAPNGKIYGIPYDASNIFKIDPDTDTVSTINSPFDGFLGGVLAPNGKIYAPPFNASNVLKIDPSTISIDINFPLSAWFNKL